MAMLVLCALALSLGWGIRGNFGHEFGAMIPGALAALAAVLTSGRADWQRRGAYFGLFGALGWSFGGSMSYMMVISYTHSGAWDSQLYGFACLFVLGFLWGALGGAGTALPACLDHDRLRQLFAPMLAVFVAWMLQDFIVPYLAHVESAAKRHESWLYWYDTDWIAALLALVAVLVLVAIRRRWCWGSSLVAHLAVGWWISFLTMVLLVDGLGINVRMTPPRGDNWAGILGMTLGAIVFFCRQRLDAVVFAMLVSGFVGGLGFSGATFLKLVEVKFSNAPTNWHSILEQTYGLINGLGIGLTMLLLARRLPVMEEEAEPLDWTQGFAAWFVLIGITYLNIVKNVPNWIQQKAIPAQMHGIASRHWFELAYLLLAIGVAILLWRHRRARLAIVPENPQGQVQLLFLLLLWWIVIGNLMRAIPPFAEQRLVTEGVLHANAVACTLVALLAPGKTGWPKSISLPTPRTLAAIASVGLVMAVGSVFGMYKGTRALHGDEFVKHGGYHVRFGPDAQTGKPEKGKAHP